MYSVCIYDPGPRSRSPPPPPPQWYGPPLAIPQTSRLQFADSARNCVLFAAFGWCQALFVGYSQAFGISDSLFAGL